MAAKKSVFWKIYFVILALFAVALIVGVFVLINWLRGYENAQPKHLAKETFDSVFANFDAEKYMDMCENSGSSQFETRENVVAYLKEATDGKTLEYMRVSSADKSTYKYIVKAGDAKIASFLLTEDTSSKSKFKDYKAGDFEVYTGSKSAVTVTAPKGYKVFVNGVEAGESCITEKDIKTPSCDHMPDGVTGTLCEKYKVTGLIATPEVTATDAGGAAAEVKSEKTGVYTVELNSDEALKSEYNDYVLEAIKKYAVYMQYDSSVAVMGFGQIKGYFDPSSELYEDIRTVENMFVIEYTSYEFANEETSEYVRYDDNTFSCRVSFTHILHRRGSSDYKDFLDLTIYLRNVNGKYLIYDMSQN